MLGAPAAAAPVAYRRVFGHPLQSRVVNSNDDERFKLAFLDQILGELIEPPFVTQESGFGIEEVLPVMHIQHRVTSVFRYVVIRRQINFDVSLIGISER
jgi:hypothetical protein